MQGNQAVELTDSEILLSCVLDQHFTDDNCDGVLVALEFLPPYDCIKFECKKCHRMVRLDA